jgi:hypothetical protein
MRKAFKSHEYDPARTVNPVRVMRVQDERKVCVRPAIETDKSSPSMRCKCPGFRNIDTAQGVV